ncbi:MAG: hypothetical protein QF704_09550, partial [Anaerolineales bacterium]|nr:hypothetical protein [Anaerolineales bacterium]
MRMITMGLRYAVNVLVIVPIALMLQRVQHVLVAGADSACTKCKTGSTYMDDGMCVGVCVTARTWANDNSGTPTCTTCDNSCGG